MTIPPFDDYKPPLQLVEKKVRENEWRWLDKSDSYWMMRLMQEVGQLASSLAGDHHKDTLVHELIQIASIAINWLEFMRKR